MEIDTEEVIIDDCIKDDHDNIEVTVEVDCIKDEHDDIEVTVEVVPQTVNEIIYMTEQDTLNADSSYYILEEDEFEEEDNEKYEIGVVDTTGLPNTTLTLDDTKSYVLLQPNLELVDSNTVFITEEETNEIYYDERDEWNLHRCNICGKQFCSLAEFNTHNDRHYKNMEYKCKVCGSKFSRPQALSNHFKTTHDLSKYICSICGCACISEIALFGHYRKHEPKQFSCDSCDAEYDNASDLCNHKKTHTKMLYACNKCDAEFASTSAVSMHLRQVHAQPKRKVPVAQENLVKFCELARVDKDNKNYVGTYQRCLKAVNNPNGNVGKKPRLKKKR